SNSASKQRRSAASLVTRCPSFVPSTSQCPAAIRSFDESSSPTASTGAPAPNVAPPTAATGVRPGGAGGPSRVPGKDAVELAPRVEAELREDLAQVVLARVGAGEQPGGVVG